MNISDRFRYLYFVVPKTGSTTVRHSLKPFTDIGVPVTRFEQHLTIENFLMLDGSINAFDTYFKFSFVRNPYDRIYSGYLQDKLASVSWDNWITAKKSIFDVIGDDFNRYLQEYVAQADIIHEWDWICFCPMTAFTHHNGKYALDWYGKVENLTEDLKILGDHLNIDIHKVPDLNVKKRAHHNENKYLSMYTRDSIKLVNRLYKNDFEFFNYPMLNPYDFPTRLPK